MIYHFMMGPDWTEGCASCSFLADHIDGSVVHLAHRDVTLVAVSRAPLADLEAFRKRMGWRFTWASSFGSEFNYDYGVSFTAQQLASGRAHLQLRQAALSARRGTGAERVLPAAVGR